MIKFKFLSGSNTGVQYTEGLLSGDEAKICEACAHSTGAAAAAAGETVLQE